MDWNKFLDSLTTFELQDLSEAINRRSADKLILTSEEVLFLQAGDKIATIKSVRTRTGLGLREAKNAVEVYQKENS